MEEKYYTLKEVASLLKVTYMTVFRWVKNKKLIAFRVGKQYRVTENELKKNFIKSNK